MGYAKHIGRIGALAVALGIGKIRHTATRMTVSVAVATVVSAATVMPAGEATVSPAVRLSADSAACIGTAERTCALMIGGTAIPTWNAAEVEVIMDQFIAPTHPPTYPGQTIEPVAVTTPEELWPGGRWIGPVICPALCPASVFGPGGSGWPDPDEPLWKLSGLFSRTFDQSVQAGLIDLEDAMADSGNDHLVIYGYSQGAVIANLEKQRLAEQYPVGTTAPDIDFVLSGDPNLPNGGLLARFPGLYIPILDFSFNGPAATDTQFETVEINRQYDLMSDFPLYPLNFIADLNAVLGFIYVHIYPFDVSLAPDPSTSPPIESQYGDTTYYFFETQDLPLFGPLRTVGVPESVIDVFEPFFREIVELGYDRSIPQGEPTPARLIPALDPATVTKDLVNAIGEGINNAAALIGAPAPSSISAAQTADNTDQENVVEQRGPAPETTHQRIIDDVNDGVAQDLAAIEPQLPASPVVKSVAGDERTTVRSADNLNGSRSATATIAHKTPVRDAVKKADNDIKKVVTKVSDNIKKALSGGEHGDDGGGGTAEPAP